MSVNQRIEQFLEKVGNDSDLANQYNNAKDLKELADVATGAGFPVSAQELQDYFKNNGDLSGDDLNNISGGSSMMGNTTSSGGGHGGWYSGD